MKEKSLKEGMMNTTIQSLQLFYGIQVPKEEKKAIELCLQESNKGNKFAEALRNYHGWEMEINKEKSLKLFSYYFKSTKNVPESKVERSYCLYFLSLMYKERKESNNKKNTKNSEKLLMKSVKMENPLAIYFYSVKKLIENKIAKGLEYLNKAVEMNYSSAINFLATICFEGRYLQKNIKKSIELFEKAVELNDTVSMNTLAEIYLMGKEGIEKNKLQSILLYETAIDLNDPVAMFNLGETYIQGRGDVKHNEKRGIELLEKSSQMNHLNSINNLGIYYLQGSVVHKNINKGIEMLERAVQMNHINTIKNLSKIYFHGTYDVDKNYKMALELLLKASQMKDIDSIRNLAKIYLNGKYNIEKNIEKAVQNFEISSRMGDSQSLFELAKIYHNGNEMIDVDLDKSAFYYYKCYKLNKKKRFESLLILKKNFKQNKINWREEFHLFWMSTPELNNQIIAILLSSKHRKESKMESVRKYLVKGISKNIIKFLCHLKQK